jgi:hypothetical protein
VVELLGKEANLNEVYKVFLSKYIFVDALRTVLYSGSEGKLKGFCVGSTRP